MRFRIINQSYIPVAGLGRSSTRRVLLYQVLVLEYYLRTGTVTHLPLLYVKSLTSDDSTSDNEAADHQTVTEQKLYVP